MIPATIEQYVQGNWSLWLDEEAPSTIEGAVFSRGAVTPSRATIFIFADQATAPRLVLKVSFDEDASFLSREFESLQEVQRLASPLIRRTAPTPLGLDPVGPLVVEAMTALSGVHPSMPRLNGRKPLRGGRAVADFLFRTRKWSQELAASTAIGHTQDESTLSDLVIEFSSVFPAPDQTASRLESFARALEGSDIKWKPCRQHGDLTAGNVLFSGTELRVLDWELSDGLSPPWFDSAYVWLGLVLLHHHRRARGSVTDSLCELWSRESWIGALGREFLARAWNHPLPLSWALTLVAMTTALRSTRTNRSGRNRWATLATSLISDNGVRQAVTEWAPAW